MKFHFRRAEMPTLNAGRSSLSAQRPSPSARRTCGLAFIVLLAGCARAATPAGVVPREDRVSLVVENAHWNDVTVHLLHGSTPRRLGSVRSMSTAELAIPPAYVIGATDITLAVAPLASNESYVLA